MKLFKLGLLAGALSLGVILPAKAGGVPKLTPEEMKKATQMYFDRCAGCHGMLRKGATGPALTPDITRQRGLKYLKTIITNGTPGGMPDWGRQGILSKKEIDLIARYLMHEPPEPPLMSLAEMKKWWKVYIPPEARPTKPQHKLNWKNFMGIILRDVGKVAIVDGDTKKLVSIVDTGFAVHIFRSSGTGRYFLTIGRDGKATLIDLWLKKPDKVAEVKVCYDARSIDTSKYKGPKGDYMDKLAIVGCYWPPSFVLLDGQTLEPLKIIDTSDYTWDTNEYVREARVASIVASHHDPEWIVSNKEPGKVLIVNYKDPTNIKMHLIDAERFLHDGGWDLSKRYFLVAANMRNKIVVIDSVEKKFVAEVETGVKPHPGRGANFVHPRFGPVWCTGHLGSNNVACIGTDPVNRSRYAWKLVGNVELPGPGGGTLFVKTHPKSPHIWVDRTLSADPKLQRQLYVIDKDSLKVIKTVNVIEELRKKGYKNIDGRVVHPEFDMHGKEVWVSVWGRKDKPTAIVVFDDKTMKIKKVITGDWVRTPTGIFNVYTTTHDVY
ncbi:nitrite reductase [Hydrogenivirga sp. 128-5-R1-1]|uniref:nitrite reductase n=1 Tax=Hydrogenivirga sp. 128-5-R1-1 TaxID=392423 RepID=UPI00015F15AF|nr:nitrite reductase [Hydrogenivirga sp. 128-5-R1-1]EDP74743.1 nitrite reductase (NO-forming) [Hydrogenivirga sp. 128-5-R1-1]